MSSTALPVSMKSFKKLLTLASPDTTICVRGRHAVGKSEGVYQGAAERFSDFYKNPENCRKAIEAFGGSIRHADHKDPVTEWSYDLGLPVVERRLSQMTEGDIIGLPIMDGQVKSTQFKPCDWLILSCELPVLLFLDERNRALEGVKQAVFQLADSKVFYGHRLHPETCISIAENVGDAYTVNQSDPAEISRAATIILEPTVEEWLDWTKDKCHYMAIDFWRQNQKLIEHTGPFEPNKKYPDRRAWFKLDQELQRLGLYETPEDHFFYVMTGAFCGVEVAAAFKKFCCEQEKHVSAEDILKSWTNAKRKVSRQGAISNEIYIELVSKLGNFLDKHQLDDAEAVEVSRFMYDAPAEARISLFSTLQKNIKNLIRVHNYVKDLIVRTSTGEDTSSLKAPESLKRSGDEPVGGGKVPAPRKTKTASK